MSRIPELNKEAMEACQLYVDNLIKPIHSLGKLEEICCQDLQRDRGKFKPSSPEQGHRHFPAGILLLTGKTRRRDSSPMMK